MFIPYLAKCNVCRKRRRIVSNRSGITTVYLCRPCDKVFVDRINDLFPSWPKTEYAV